MKNQRVRLGGSRVVIISTLFAILFSFPFFFFGCSDPESANVNHHQDSLSTGIQGEVKPLRVVATTGMIADLAKNIGGDQVEVKALMPRASPSGYIASCQILRDKAFDVDVVEAFTRQTESRIFEAM